MQTINAFSLAPDAHEWLAYSHHPRILHVFDDACNLINERRDILSIVNQQIGNGPFNLVIEDDILFSDHLNAQSSISIRTDQLHLGDLIINTAGAKFWTPRPDWETLHTRRDDILHQLMSSPGFRLGLDPPFAKNARSYSTAALQTKLLLTNYKFPISNSLLSALANADLPNCIYIAKQLAGLGSGLTPAGDDFILGAILATWIIQPLDAARVFAKEITNTAAPLTTSLSAALLRCAGRGDAGILWHNFFDALIYEDSVSIQKTMDRILAVGETSGVDALAGFMGMFIRWAELGSSKIP